MRIDKVQRVALAPDEALLVVIKGVEDLDAAEMEDIQTMVKRSLVNVIPNADMGRVAIMVLPEDAEVEVTSIKMEKR